LLGQNFERLAVPLLGLVFSVGGYRPNNSRDPPEERKVQNAADDAFEHVASENHGDAGQKNGEEHKAGMEK